VNIVQVVDVSNVDMRMPLLGRAREDEAHRNHDC